MELLPDIFAGMLENNKKNTKVMKSTQEIITKKLTLDYLYSDIYPSQEIAIYISKCFASHPGIIQISSALISMEFFPSTFRSMVEENFKNE